MKPGGKLSLVVLVVVAFNTGLESNADSLFGVLDCPGPGCPGGNAIGGNVIIDQPQMMSPRQPANNNQLNGNNLGNICLTPQGFVPLNSPLPLNSNCYIATSSGPIYGTVQRSQFMGYPM